MHIYITYIIYTIYHIKYILNIHIYIYIYPLIQMLTRANQMPTPTKALTLIHHM